MDDSKIIDLFFERSEEAIVELSKKYGAVCMKVSMNILNDKMDAEECVNDAYFAAWNTIPPEKPNPLLTFLCRIVRNLSVNLYRKKNAQKRKSNYDLCAEELENLLSADNGADDAHSEEELAVYIDEFLDSLSRTDCMIFVRRFWYVDSYKDIAKATGLREGAVRTRLSRTKAALKVFLEKKGVII